jgi:hypothetical protein
MKPQMQTTLLCGLVLLLAQTQRLGAQAGARPHRIASDLPAAEQLVAALPPTNNLRLLPVVRGLFEWPAPETLSAQKAREDRSKTIPPLFRQPKIGDAKPIRLGARSPEAACKEAEQWIRRVLKPEWVPDDLAPRLQPLQREPASESVIVCRYSIDGHAIQVNQNRGSMWVVIKPPKGSLAAQDAKGLGSAVFSTCFLNGDRMASLAGKEIDGTGNVRVWRPDYSAVIPPGALENWWGWRVWLTDGDAVAVFLGKRSEDSARNIMPDDPWF